MHACRFLQPAHASGCWMRIKQQRQRGRRATDLRDAVEQELEAVRVLHDAAEREVGEHGVHVVIVERGLAVVSVQLDARARVGLDDERRGEQAVGERRERVHGVEQRRKGGRRERAPARGVDGDGAVQCLRVGVGAVVLGRSRAPGAPDPVAHPFQHAEHKRTVVEVRGPARRGVPDDEVLVLELPKVPARPR